MLHHRPDIGNMLREMSSMEITEWYVYLQLLREEEKAEAEKRKLTGSAAGGEQKVITGEDLKNLPKGTIGLHGLG